MKSLGRMEARLTIPGCYKFVRSVELHSGKFALQELGARSFSPWMQGLCENKNIFVLFIFTATLLYIIVQL